MEEGPYASGVTDQWEPSCADGFDLCATARRRCECDVAMTYHNLLTVDARAV
jgi:hypothetical protein